MDLSLIVQTSVWIKSRTCSLLCGG